MGTNGSMAENLSISPAVRPVRTDAYPRWCGPEWHGRVTSTHLGIDFGTSRTVAMLRRDDGDPTSVLFDGSPLLPSAVFAPSDGGVLPVPVRSVRRIAPQSWRTVSEMPIRCRRRAVGGAEVTDQPVRRGTPYAWDSTWIELLMVRPAPGTRPASRGWPVGRS